MHSTDADIRVASSAVKGDRVKIHPASDWFMRGEQWATVAFWSPTKKLLRVVGQRSGKRFWLIPGHVLHLS